MADEQRKVAFICSKGSLDMAYPALIMGWAALGNGIDVTVFFTFWGMDLINEKRVDKLQISPIGNTSMKMGEFGIPNIVSAVPGMTAVATSMLKSQMSELEVPSVREYFEMLVDAGAKLYACKMSVDMMKLTKDDFIPGVIDIVTAGEFFDLTEGADIVFI